MDAALPQLLAKVNSSKVCSFFNTGECGLFYRLAPLRPNGQESPLGRKASEDHISVLVCANADGTEKVELMFMGTAWKAKAFHKTGHEYGPNYHANKNP